MPRKKNIPSVSGKQKKTVHAKAQAENQQLPKLLVETSWEVCHQVGGIYTVLRSKVPAVMEKWQDNYCLVGPYLDEGVYGEFEEISPDNTVFSKAAELMKKERVDVHYGRWMVTGNPQVVLVDVKSAFARIDEIKYFLWKHHNIQIPDYDDLANQACLFGWLAFVFIKYLAGFTEKQYGILAHFHEWLTGLAISELRRENIPVSLLFTTHATLLGRYLATNEFDFYERMHLFNWLDEAKKYNIEARVRIERMAALDTHCFSTVSEVTARECQFLLGRTPDVILPNGINIERFVALHEFQLLHREYKNMINQFVMGHFFPSYSFDLDKTLYFFTSGRFEYANKGFDITVEALHRLNELLVKEETDITIVMFIITRQSYHSINPDVLQLQSLTAEIKNTCHSILDQIAEKLLYEVTSSPKHDLPLLNDLVDEYWKLRLRRTQASWRTDRLPIVVTHNLKDDAFDSILLDLRRHNLVNKIQDKVKIVYHPDFVSSTNPLFRMDYNQFVRGCHMGIFPSYYEPWGYTPLECIANGIPAITSNLSGFGDYVSRIMPDHDEQGIFVLDRKTGSREDAVNQLVRILYGFIAQNRRERISQRNAVENRSETFDWHNLLAYYEQAYLLAEKKGNPPKQ
ncbi:MAG: glycosyltransferase [Spirochaetales bacterium]|nr:glycosyltransferase [Spirochaetales bacterium]